VYRDHGTKGFYESKSRHSSASVLKGEVLERAQHLLDEGQSVPEVAKDLNVLGTRAQWFTVVFDREGYSAEFFAQLLEKRIAVLTYHKFPSPTFAFVVDE
jgi:hypothetical protein